VLQVCRWKRAERGNDGSKNITRKRLTREKCDAVFRRPNTCVSIQQKADSFRTGDRRSPTRALNQLGAPQMMAAPAEKPMAPMRC